MKPEVVRETKIGWWTGNFRELSTLIISRRPLNTVTNLDFLVSNCFCSTYETKILAKLADKGLYGCTSVVGAPRKLMWASWLIQPGQSLTNRPEQNFACRAVKNCVEPKGWRIVGHNESEGIKYGAPKS